MVDWDALKPEEKDAVISKTGATVGDVIKKIWYVIAVLSEDPVAQSIAWGLPQGDYIVNESSEIIEYCKKGALNK